MNVWVSILRFYILLSLTGFQTEHRNPEGRTYWFNTNTRESVWEKPDGEWVFRVLTFGKNFSILFSIRFEDSIRGAYSHRRFRKLRSSSINLNRKLSTKPSGRSTSREEGNTTTM